MAWRTAAIGLQTYEGWVGPDQTRVMRASTMRSLGGFSIEIG